MARYFAKIPPKTKRRHGRRAVYAKQVIHCDRCKKRFTVIKNGGKRIYCDTCRVELGMCPLCGRRKGKNTTCKCQILGKRLAPMGKGEMMPAKPTILPKEPGLFDPGIFKSNLKG